MNRKEQHGAGEAGLWRASTIPIHELSTFLSAVAELGILPEDLLVIAEERCESGADGISERRIVIRRADADQIMVDGTHDGDWIGEALCAMAEATG